MNMLLSLEIGVAAVAALGIAANCQTGDAWKAAPCSLTTPWANEVNPSNPLPEYPRPQMVRNDWKNLNGLWDYAITAKDAKCPDTWDGKILVPFGIESSLSGVKKGLSPDQSLWYRRSFDVSEQWLSGGHRLLLHFGAVDWECKVYINNTLMGEHKGGYDSFTFDITDLVKPGDNQIVLSVHDPTAAENIAFGKQSNRPDSAWYTSTSGIWQTVWLEPVSDVSITELKMVPDIKAGVLRLKVSSTGSFADCRVEAEALTGDVKVGSISGSIGNELLIPIPNARLWSPDDPFLYDLRVSLKRDGKTVDSVGSYFGMRDVRVGKDAYGCYRILLNGKPVFNLGVLDQGFWPDGVYTAPTDEALRFDVETTKRMGFNTIRKHIKVEPDRWYYHCDKLGILVWQDVVARRFNIRKENDVPEYAKQFESEIGAMIDSHYNHPSIIMWTLFNELWGMYDTNRIATWMKSLDSSRLINAHSGGPNEGAGDIADTHIYSYPGMPDFEEGKARVLGEFGGIGDPIEGHEWKPGVQWGHAKIKPGDVAFVYEDIMNRLKPLVLSGLSGAIFTQPYDVEIEENGLLTYDRKVFKIPPEWINAVNSSIYEFASAKISNVLPISQKNDLKWQYTTSKPIESWYQPGFNDSVWTTGSAPFGGAGGSTRFDGSDIWLRCNFEVRKAVKNPYFSVINREQAEVFIDGVQVGGTAGVFADHAMIPAFPNAAALLKPGKHSIAIHCHRVLGDKPLDFGIVDVSLR